MSAVLVLDSEPFSILAKRKNRKFAEVHAALEAARRLNRIVVVPAVVLAELYRGKGHNTAVDACLSRETGMLVKDTGRALARLVGTVLSAAPADSSQLVDAHLVACAVDAGSGVVLTGDQVDLNRLSAPFPNVTVASI